MPRATATDIADRIDQLQGMILAGSNNTECLAFARQTWGVSRSQGYKLLKRAWQQIKNDIDESGIDRHRRTPPRFDRAMTTMPTEGSLAALRRAFT